MQMKKVLALAAMTLSITLGANAYAADQAQASEQSVRELMALTGAGKIGIQVMQNMLASMKKMAPQAPESYWAELMKEANPDELVNLSVPIYQKHFTEEEVQEIIKFYKTPTGQKMLRELPQVMQEGMAAGQQWGQQVAMKALEKIKLQQGKKP